MLFKKLLKLLIIRNHLLNQGGAIHGKKSESGGKMFKKQNDEIIAIMASAIPNLNFAQAQSVIKSRKKIIIGLGNLFKKHLKAVNTDQPSNIFKFRNRVYDLVPLFDFDETPPEKVPVLEIADAARANLGKDDGNYFLERQEEIPQEFRGKFNLVFVNWRHPCSQRRYAYLFWCECRWQQYFRSLDYDWNPKDRLVKRIS